MAGDPRPGCFMEVAGLKLSGCPISRVFCEKWGPSTSPVVDTARFREEEVRGFGPVPRLPTPGKHGAP